MGHFRVDSVHLCKKSLSTEKLVIRRVYEFATGHKPLPPFSKKRVYERVDHAHKLI